jgi:hypothetical protein
MLAVEPLRALCTVPALRVAHVYGLRLLNASSELALFDALEALAQPIPSPIPIPVSTSALVNLYSRTALPVLMPWILGGRVMGEQYDSERRSDRLKRWAEREQLREIEQKQKSRRSYGKTKKELKAEAEDFKEEQTIEGFVGALRNSLTAAQRDFIELTQREIIAQFKLNADQRAVLQSCVSWIVSPKQPNSEERPANASSEEEEDAAEDGTLSTAAATAKAKATAASADAAASSAASSSSDTEFPSPITLVHGTFGSGKSYLLVVIILFFCRVLEQLDPQNTGTQPAMPFNVCTHFLLDLHCTVRILIAAQTNVAVDGILLGLQAHGFDKFARVGALRKIAKPVLKHVLHHAERGKQDDGNRHFFVNDLLSRAHSCAGFCGLSG